PVRYSRAVDGVLEVGPTYAYHYVSSPEEYQQAWQEMSPRLKRFDVIAYRDTYDPDRRYPDAKPWPAYKRDTRDDHRPFYFYDPDEHRLNGRYVVRTAEEITASWSATETAGAFFYGGLALFYLLALMLGINHWLRLARHAKAEAAV